MKPKYQRIKRKLERERWIERNNQIKEDHQRIIDILEHEMRTPLVTIKGYSQLLKMGKITPERLQTSYSRIENAAILLEDFSYILRLSSINNAELKKNPVKLNLEKILKTQAIVFENALIESKLALKIKQDKPEYEPIEIYGNPGAIRFVFATLLGNGLNYAPEGTRITQALRIIDNHLELMTENADSDGKQRKIHGTHKGIGLPYTRRIISELKGTFEVYDYQRIPRGYDAQEIFGYKEAIKPEKDIFGIRITLPMSELSAPEK